MAGYILIDLEITDPEGFQEYLKLAGPTVKQYGGKVLIGGAASATLEGDWHTHLLSVGEFESVEQALRWYNSAEYAPAKALRFKREMQKSYGLRVLDGDLLTSSRRLSPGDSFPHEKGFLLRRLRVSLGALLLQARAFASTGLTFREPRGSFSVLGFIRYLGSRDPGSKKKESVQRSTTLMLLPKRTIKLVTNQHYSV